MQMRDARSNRGTDRELVSSVFDRTRVPTPNFPVIISIVNPIGLINALIIIYQ